MSAIREMTERSLIHDSTTKNLERLYSGRFSLLVADGGAGAIHGDPTDAIRIRPGRLRSC
jgi:hypothetical protein